MQSRTSRQWPESNMVQPSKDGELTQGGEFINSDLMDILKGLGIAIEQSDTLININKMEGPQRAIRTIMEKAQCLHFTACLPQSWWKSVLTTPVS